MKDFKSAWLSTNFARTFVSFYYRSGKLGMICERVVEYELRSHLCLLDADRGSWVRFWERVVEYELRSHFCFLLLQIGVVGYDFVSAGLSTSCARTFVSFYCRSG